MEIKRSKGFTLVELLISISVIIILTAISIPIYYNLAFSRSSEESSRSIIQNLSLAETKALSGVGGKSWDIAFRLIPNNQYISSGQTFSLAEGSKILSITLFTEDGDFENLLGTDGVYVQFKKVPNSGKGAIYKITESGKDYWTCNTTPQIVEGGCPPEDQVSRNLTATCDVGTAKYCETSSKTISEEICITYNNCQCVGGKYVESGSVGVTAGACPSSKTLSGDACVVVLPPAKKCYDVVLVDSGGYIWIDDVRLWGGIVVSSIEYCKPYSMEYLYWKEDGNSICNQGNLAPSGNYNCWYGGDLGDGSLGCSAGPICGSCYSNYSGKHAQVLPNFADYGYNKLVYPKTACSVPGAKSKCGTYGYYGGVEGFYVEDCTCSGKPIDYYFNVYNNCSCVSGRVVKGGSIVSTCVATPSLGSGCNLDPLYSRNGGSCPADWTQPSGVSCSKTSINANTTFQGKIYSCECSGGVDTDVDYKKAEIEISDLEGTKVYTIVIERGDTGIMNFYLQ
ncbi:MAG: prepilin-type N-terminal cleavage/methylation domain-containing protein [Patescibacteria group bacterium]